MLQAEMKYKKESSVMEKGFQSIIKKKKVFSKNCRTAAGSMYQCRWSVPDRLCRDR